MSYFRAHLSPSESALASLAAAKKTWPDWATGTFLDHKEDGLWRVNFEAEPRFFLTIETEALGRSELDESINDSVSSSPLLVEESACLIGLVWIPHFSLFKPISSAKKVVDVLVMREEFMRKFMVAAPESILSALA